MIVFAEDRRFWTPHARRTKVVRPDTGGRYEVSSLAAGDYFVAAADVTREEATEAVLASLQSRAIRVTLELGKVTARDLTVP